MRVFTKSIRFHPVYVEHGSGKTRKFSGYPTFLIRINFRAFALLTKLQKFGTNFSSIHNNNKNKVFHLCRVLTPWKRIGSRYTHGIPNIRVHEIISARNFSNFAQPECAKIYTNKVYEDPQDQYRFCHHFLN